MNLKQSILTSWIFTLLTLVACQPDKPAHHIFLEKLIGEWKLANKPVIEKWSYLDGKFVASVYIISADERKVTEKIRILENDDGIFYEANVDDQNQGNGILFKLVELTENKIIFENKEHDFPQMITYKFLDDNTVMATTSGQMNGEHKEINFDYIRNQKSTK
jgi:hypothetical protein